MIQFLMLILFNFIHHVLFNCINLSAVFILILLIYIYIYTYIYIIITSWSVVSLHSVQLLCLFYSWSILGVFDFQSVYAFILYILPTISTSHWVVFDPCNALMYINKDNNKKVKQKIYRSEVPTGHNHYHFKQCQVNNSLNSIYVSHKSKQKNELY